MTQSLLKLVQFTDPHLYADAGGRLRGIATLPALQATLAAAADDVQAAEAILVTGDLVQDDAGGYARFREVFAPLGKPVLCIPGNHDDAAELAAALADPPFRVCGHSDWLTWRVVMLDSSVPGMAQGRLAQESLQRLDATLADPAHAHALVCLHHHPIAMGSRWLDSVGLTNANDFFTVIQRHPRVRGIVFGHVHQSFDTEHNGVRILGTPSTCAQFLPRSANFQLDSQPPAWRTLNLSADGAIATRIHWVSPLQSPATSPARRDTAAAAKHSLS
ncbi:MAG: 3',5'-cyclic-AMP phosphodiesterase [Pseudomonadota bacterium]